MLRARLYEHELRKQQAEQQKLEDAKSDIGWGHQIRSYVLDQSRIKDLRTSYETGNTQGRARRRPRRVHRGQPETGRISCTPPADEAHPHMAGGGPAAADPGHGGPSDSLPSRRQPLVERSEAISPLAVAQAGASSSGMTPAPAPAATLPRFPFQLA